MKKFFSLLCALAIVLSANAVPAKTLGKNLKMDGKELKAASVKTVKESGQLQKAPMVSAFKAPQAKQETFNLTADNYTATYYTADNDVWVKLLVGDSTFYFDVIVADGTNSMALGTTYTLIDMIANYTYLKDGDGNKTSFTDASIMMSMVSYEEQQLVRFDASATTATGDIYNIVYEEAPFIITGDTIEVVFTESMRKPIFEDNLVQVRTTTAAYDIAFCYTVVTAGSVAGTFSNDDMNLKYTFVNNLEAIEAHCVAAELAGHIDLEGWILAKDGNVYHVTMFFDIPTVQSQETITATNLNIDDSYASFFGAIWVDASNEDYSISITFIAEDVSEMLGTFSLDDLYSFDLTDTDDNDIELYSGSITVAATNDGYVITGTVLGMNGVEYTLNLSYVLPDPTSQETINGTGELYLMSQNGMNYWQAIAFNADESRYVSILAIADSPAGSYAVDDLYASYTYVGKFIGTDTTWYNVINAGIVVAVSGDAATITGTVLGQSENDAADVTEFTLNLSLEIIDETGGGEEGNEYDATEAFKHVFPEYNVDDQYLAKYNVLVVEANDEDMNTISLEFNVPAGTTTLAAGVYSITDTNEDNTVTTGYIDQYIYGSFAGSVNEEGYINVPLWLIFNGTVTIHENGVIEVNAINTKGAVIECLLGTWPEAIENTAVDAAATKAVRNGQLVIIKNGVEYNAQGAMLK